MYYLNYLAPKIQRKIMNLFQTLKIIKSSPLCFLFHIFISALNCDCLYALWPSFRRREGRMILSQQFSSLISGYSLRPEIWVQAEKDLDLNTLDA